MFTNEYFDKLHDELVKPSVVDEIAEQTSIGLREILDILYQQTEENWERIRELLEEEKRRDG